jgi:TonB family protein
MATLEGNRQAQLTGTVEPAAEPRQRRQMLIALALLLLALILVIYKDHQFWFPTHPADEADVVEDEPQPATTSASKATAPPTTIRAKAKKASAPAPAAASQGAPTAVVNRAVLPPLEVEVVAGDSRRMLQPGNPSINVQLQPVSPAPAPVASSNSSSQVATAAEHVNISRSTADIVSRPVQPSYPLLAKQMKVQGSVILQALIGKDGNIQDLQVLSGPTILSAAAREAVKQWRFKPYLQSGEPVDTEAKITVNFTISTY